MKYMCLFPYDAAAVGGTSPACGNAKANQACISCRKQKRKCDKAIPSCALCTRMSRFCDYSDAPPNPTVEDVAALRVRLAELESKLQDATRHSSVSASASASIHHTSVSPPAEEFFQDHCPPVFPHVEAWARGMHDFDPTMFLDAALFRHTGLPVPPPMVNIPHDVLQCLGDREQLQQSLTDYFADVHPWFPVVRRKRINISSPLWDSSPESTLLCLAMVLLAWQPTDGLLVTRNYLYLSAKQFCAQLENVGVASLCYLQALLLIAMYEYGHGIYPAAWMTVGHCVRYADFIGLPSYKESNSMLGNCMTWVDAEERRRAWWGVYVLDKVICVGSDKRPSCGEPAANEILPVPDEAWDSGDASLAIQRTATSPRPEPQPSFARLCQAALLVSRTLRHCQRAKLLKLQHRPPDGREAAGLTEAALELAACAQAEIVARPEKYFALVPALTLAYSAVFKIAATHLPLHPQQNQLHNNSSSNNRDDISSHSSIDTTNIHLDARKKAASHMHDIAHDIAAFTTTHEEGLAKISPFALDAIYTAGVTTMSLSSSSSSAWWWREQQQQCGGELPISISEQQPGPEAAARKCLARIRARWAVAAHYETLLEQQHDMSANNNNNNNNNTSSSSSSSVVAAAAAFALPLAIVPTVPSSTLGL